MPVSVKDYLNSMEKLSSSIDRSFKKKNDVSLATKTQALLSQLIEAISFANSIDFRKKRLNKEVPSGGQTGKEVLKQLKAQEALVQQLAEERKRNSQRKDSSDIDTVYDSEVGNEQLNKRIKSLEMERDDLKKKYDEVMKENEELKQLLSKMDVSDFQFIDDSSDDS